MVLSTWLCTHGSKNMLVKIVHPGGHVELHDRPLLAAEIMLRNPRCCVAYPHVFKQPWAIVPPDTMLRLGQKFYVVPIGTIRKLQKLSLKLSPSPSSLHQHAVGSPSLSSSSSSSSSLQPALGHGDQEDESASSCCLFVNHNTPKISYACLNQTSSDDPHRRDNSNKRTDSCFTCLLTGTAASSQTKELNRKRARDSHVIIRKGNSSSSRGSRSPKRHSSFDSWQPSLASIVEE